MSKTIDGKFIFTHKGEDYVPLNDYVKLLQEKEDLREKVILLRASEPMLELEKYYGDRDRYKEVIEEVREIIKTAVPKNNGDYMMINFDNWRKLEERLDKAKENK